MTLKDAFSGNSALIEQALSLLLVGDVYKPMGGVRGSRAGTAEEIAGSK